MVAKKIQWLSWEGTGYYGHSLVAKEVYVCHGNSTVAMEVSG
jgi:hypothetical protein